ncbi:hypothetical protein CTR2_R40070 [Comamonas thiooxydans]|uniref:hypothetical protein n=1 Tax=Comamonas thiooxydans TaxID=363952 RepID=UPI0011214C27|nr:hypothetical protein [Comamonas thiooxydans]BDR10669.1 hypothetical protein CTR2_R40070 [Comamonas thiooxydans]
MTTYQTGNPLGSQDPRDLFDNAQNIDDAINSQTSEVWQDRLGRLRKTWRGIEQKAEFDIAQAVSSATADAHGYRDQALEARDDARAAASAIGPLKFYDTYAQALGDIADIPIDGLIEVSADETLDGARTRYFKRSGDVLELSVNLDQLRLDLATDAGAQLIATRQPEDGSVKRLVIEKLSEIPTFGDYEDISSAVAAAVESSFILGAIDSVVIRVPSQAATLQSAFERITPLTQQCRITVLIESGFQPTSGVELSNADYSRYKISSEDSEVTLSSLYVGDNFLKLTNAISPVVDVLINAAGKGGRTFYAERGSFLLINPGKGVKNPQSDGIYVNMRSSAYISGCVSIGAVNGRNLWITRNSTCECTGATFDGATDYNIWISRSSSAYGESVTCKNAGSAIGATRYSIASFNLMTADNLDSVAIAISAFIFVNDVIATNVKKVGLSASEGGEVTGRNAKITGVVGSATYGCVAENLGKIICPSAEISGFNLSGLRAYYGGGIAAFGAKIENCLIGIDARYNGSVDAYSGTIQSCGRGIFARDGSKVSMNSGNILSSTTRGVECNSGSEAYIGLTKVTGSGEQDLRVATGAKIYATGTSTTNGAGSPAPSNTNVAAFNTFYAAGVIYV